MSEIESGVKADTTTAGNNDGGIVARRELYILKQLCVALPCLSFMVYNRW